MMCRQSLATAHARGLRVCEFALTSLALLISSAHAQAPQPYLFAQTSNSGQSGTVTFLRDDVAGPLTLLSNSASTFPHNCYPITIDPHGLFLYGMCGDGVVMYTLNSTTGAVTEVAASPFAASRGLDNMAVIAEASGQFVYLIKYDPSGTEATNNFYLDTFQVEAATPALTPLTTQQLNVAGTMEGVVSDPNNHGLSLFLNQNLNAAEYSTAILYTITFDPVSGAAILDPSDGQAVGQTARCIAISPTGNYVAVGYGATEGYFTVYSIAPNTFALVSLGDYDLGPELTAAGVYGIPGDIYFNPNGQIMYVQAPPANFAGGGLPFLVFDTSTYLILPSSPISLANASFIGNLEDPQGPFEYTPAPGGGISVYTIDPVSGLPSQPGPIASSFYPQLGSIAPLFAPFGPSGGQGTSGPALSLSTSSLTFAQTTVGQTSGPQTITLKNIGNQPVNFTSIVVSGANAGDFHESDTCMNPPVLTPNQSCLVSITYSPAAAGTSQASITVSSNAADSPQTISLSGTAIAPPPPAPQVTFTPTSIAFPGNTAEGTTSAPIVLTLTNSGNASLHITTSVLGGSNAPDFALSNSACAGTINAGANCSVSITFTPLATGFRSATWTVTDDAANSPQVVSISGTAQAAAAPQVTLIPSNILFSGNTTQGTASTPIALTLTNSGSAALHISTTALGGSNASDFVLGNSTCTGTINSGANCTVSVTFTPSDSGNRSATWTVTDDAANSPQVVAISGTALPAVTLGAAAAGGNTTASVTAGQSAQFNLQAVPGTGFSGTLTFACTGAPLGATCNVPSSVGVSNNSTTNFSVTVSTSGSGALIPLAPSFPESPRILLHAIPTLLFVLLFLFLLLSCRACLHSFERAFLQIAALTSILLLIGLNGCGGGASTSTSPPPPPPPVVTPSGTYTITVSPMATPTGSTKQFNLSPLQLTLTVK